VQRLALVLAILIASALLGFRPVYEPDLGWHLAHGRENAAGRLVRSNVFSAGYADYRQHYTSWLSETAAYAAWATGGDAGVQALMAVTLAAALALIYLACRARAAALPSMAILAVAVMVIEPRAIPRPHVASFLGMAACAFLVQRAVRARSIRPLAWAPLVVALWSNAHIECIFGVALLGVFAAGEAIAPSALTRRQALGALALAAACVPAALANPYGIGVLRYVHENASVPQLLAIAELRPAYWPQYRAFFIYLALAAVVVFAPGKRPAPWEIAATIVFAALGWRYLRLTPLVVFATAPMMAARLTVVSSAPGRWRIDQRAILVTAFALAVVMSRAPMASFISGMRVGTLHPPAFFPPAAIAFVRDAGLDGPMFNSHNLGGCRHILPSTSAASSRRRARSRRGTPSSPASTGRCCRRRGRTPCRAGAASRRRSGRRSSGTRRLRSWCGAEDASRRWRTPANTGCCGRARSSSRSPRG
jgi:hypothetical protein